MMEAAAAAGVSQATEFLDYTPRQISCILSAHRAKEEQKAQERWLLCRMIALAVHAPDRLPPPPAPFPSSREMTAEEMKQRLLNWRGKDENL